MYILLCVLPSLNKGLLTTYKQIAVQCFRFALFCSRRLRFLPFIVFPVFILAMLNNANLFCFSRENRPHPFFEDSLAISLPALAHLAR